MTESKIGSVLISSYVRARRDPSGAAKCSICSRYRASLRRDKSVNTRTWMTMLIDNARDIRLVTKVEEGPGTSSRTRMLATHKHSNHHVSNFFVTERATGTIFLLHKSRNHVMVML